MDSFKDDQTVYVIYKLIFIFSQTRKTKFSSLLAALSVANKRESTNPPFSQSPVALIYESSWQCRYPMPAFNQEGPVRFFTRHVLFDVNAFLVSKMKIRCK